MLVPDPPQDPELGCPTCGARWTPGLSDPDTGWRVPVGGPAIWVRVQGQYDSEKVHRAFIEFCRAAGALDYAARRYRRVLDSADGQDEVAQASLSRIQAMALAMLQPAERSSRVPEIVKLVIAGAMVLAIGAGTVWVLRALGIGY